MLVLVLEKGEKQGLITQKKRTSGGRSFMRLVAQIRPCLSHVHLFALTGFSALTQGAIVVMISLEGLVLSKYYKLDSAASGLLIGSISASAVAITFIVSPFSRSNPSRVIVVGLFALVAVASFMFAVGLRDSDTISLGAGLIIVPCIVFVAADFSMRPAIMMLLLHPYPHISGSISGLFALVTKVVAVAVSISVSGYFDDTPKYMMLGMATSMSAAICIMTLFFAPNILQAVCDKLFASKKEDEGGAGAEGDGTDLVRIELKSDLVDDVGGSSRSLGQVPSSGANSESDFEFLHPAAPERKSAAARQTFHSNPA
jgi:hypothetical protein